MKNKKTSQSKILRAWIKICTVMLMGILWLICCLPVITIGASSAAMYRMMFNLRSEKECGIGAFFKAFVKKLKLSTAVWIVLLLIGVVLRGVPAIFVAMKNDILTAVGLGIAGALMLLLFVVLVCAFPLCGYFDTTLKKTLRNAVFIATHNGKQAIIACILTALPLILFLVDPLIFFYTIGAWVLLYPGLVFYLGAKMFQPKFEEYDQRHQEKLLEEKAKEEEA